MDNIITANDCSLFIHDIGRRAYINSRRGRSELERDCATYHCADLLETVLSVWGNSPSVIDEPQSTEPTLDELKAQKKSEIAAERYAAETMGTTFNGVTIDTGRDSQALITGAALAAMLDSEYSLNWKTESGFIHLTAPEIIAVAQAVRAHVQSCFDREGELVAQINAATTKEELDAITW